MYYFFHALIHALLSPFTHSQEWHLAWSEEILYQVSSDYSDLIHKKKQKQAFKFAIFIWTVLSQKPNFGPAEQGVPLSTLNPD